MDLSRRLLLESDEYAERMYWDINYDHDFDDSISEISSGYHSTGVQSDVCSFSSEESRDSQPIKQSNIEPEVMKFQSVQPLCDNLKLILSMPELCDVTFLVGPEQVAIHGVKAILGTRSRKFYDLIMKSIASNNNQASIKKKYSNKKQTVGICHPFADRLVIPVRKYDDVVFRNLVQFIHCGTVNVTEETVAGLYYGACQFELPDLSKACVDFIERRVQTGDYETLLCSTRNYSHHKASQTLFDKIYAAIDRRSKNRTETSV